MLAKFRPRLTYANVISTLCLFMLLGGGAWAATSFVGSDGKIHGCVSKRGQLRVLKRGGKCKKQETPISWDQHVTHVDHAKTADRATTAGHATNAEKLNGKDPSAFQAQGSEYWHSLPLNDGRDVLGQVAYCYWSAYGGAFSNPGYFRDQDGIVHLRGLVVAHNGPNSGCGSDSFDRWITGASYDPEKPSPGLPSGYRPEDVGVFTVSSNDKPGRVDVGTDGSVRIESGYPAFADAEQWVQLDGITFRCAPSGQDGCP